MKRKTIILGLLVSSVIFASAQKTPIPVYLDDSKPVEQRIEDAISRMTVEEKVAMCHAQAKFSSAGVPRLGIPEIWHSDGPHGIRNETLWDDFAGAKWTNDSCTAFPALTCLGATFNPVLAYEYGKAIGEEARYRKKDILLGPGINIYRSPMNGRNFEYMGEDPYLSSVLVVPYVQGVQENGVAACVKHYALNNQEKWRGHINVELSDRALHEIYLPAFKAAVQQGRAWAIMGAYNKLRGTHCCHNDYLLNKLLKEDWKFDGVVVSDWDGTHDTDEAVRNGLDIEMGTFKRQPENDPFTYRDFYLADAYLAGLKSGKYTGKELDDKVRRILRLMYRTTMDRNRPYGSFATKEHADVARRIAEEGIVLLKNQNNFFPVIPGKYRKILVVGENAVRPLTVGGGSSELKVKEEISPLKGLIDKFGGDVIEYVQGYSSDRKQDDCLLAGEALEKAKVADVVLFIGGLNKELYQDCEGEDRRTFELPYGQNELIEKLCHTNKNTGVILISGNAVAMPWVKKVPAIMQSWYLGSEAGSATANVISGKVNPSGKLPFSIPKRLEDNGAHFYGDLSFPGDGTDVRYKEDIYVGYRWFDTKKIVPQFPFGYGLSYTNFKFGKIKSDKKEYGKNETILLSVELTNTGKMAGAETVQIYASQSNPSLERPLKELKGFSKVFLKAGESTVVKVEIPVDRLAFYDDTSKDWNIESDRFTLHCASSATDIKSSVTVIVK